MQFFNFLAVFGLAALAAAAPQENPASASLTPVAATPTSASPSVADLTTSTAPVSPTTACIAACDNDICCQAACVGVPCPNESDVNATTECAMNCKQGDGSAADTEAYAACQKSCINSLFLTSTGAPAATGTTARASGNSAAASATSSGSSGSANEGSASSTASSSASAESASSTGAASSNKMSFSTAGFLGVLMAALAM